MLSVYDRQYKRTTYLSNEAERGVHYFDDQLTTTIPNGLYTLDLKIPKNTPLTAGINIGYYIEDRTPQGKQLLLAIMSIDEDRNAKNIYCVDSSVQALNSYVDEIEPPTAPEQAEYYLNHTLEKSDLVLLKVESNESKVLKFGTEQRILERLQAIAKEFALELSFDTDFTPGHPPKRYVSLLKERVEDYKGFRVSSDDFLLGIDKKINNNRLATKMKVKGKNVPKQDDSAGGGTTGPTVETGPANQPPATQFDSSKASGATAISTIGWSESEVNQFKLNAADPPHVTGDYIDRFLRTHFSDSPLIGQGQTIKELADYFGVSVGAALGVWAKETTFGRGEPGKSNYNYGCIRWTSGSGFPAVTWAGSKWNNYPDKRTGIAAWFKLIRWSYLEPGAPYYSANYKEMLDFYSPPSENTQSTFKNIMWGALKAFGYNMSATAIKQNYSKVTDDPRNVTTVQNAPSTTAPGTGGTNGAITEAVIAEAHRIAALGLPYQWGGNGNPSYDCSGFVQQCYKAAGHNPSSASWPRATTHSMWAQDGKFKKISRGELKPGDLIMYDTGYTFRGDVNHVGIYLGPTLDAPNSVIHAGNPVGIKQKANSMTIIGYVTVTR